MCCFYAEKNHINTVDKLVYHNDKNIGKQHFGTPQTESSSPDRA